MRPINAFLAFATAVFMLSSCSKNSQGILCHATVLDIGNYCGSDVRIHIDAGADQVSKMLQLSGTGITVYGLYNLPGKYKVVGTKLTLGVSKPAYYAPCPDMFPEVPDLNVVFAEPASK